MEMIDEFLYILLQENSNVSTFVLKSEDVIITFLNEKDRAELEFPPLNSYYRRIIHRLGHRYNLVHRVEVTNVFNTNSTLRKIYLAKPVGETEKFEGPLLKCSDWFPRDEGKAAELVILRESSKVSSRVKKGKPEKYEKTVETCSTDPKPKLKILKRNSSQQSSSTTTDAPPQSPSILALEALSLEEREAKYQAARERIFEGFVCETETAVSIEPVKTGGPAETSDKVEISSETRIPAQTEILASESEPQPETTTDTAPTQLNPDAAPFSVCPVQEPTIKINHIYTLTPTADPLTRQDLQEILGLSPSLCIKTREIPSSFAFILTAGSESDGLTTAVEKKWAISKWVPEFYLD